MLVLAVAGNTNPLYTFSSHHSLQLRNRFSSDKVAEISYASMDMSVSVGLPSLTSFTAIQGKDCLIQKFRNSSVMLEHPTFRPKVFPDLLRPLSVLTPLDLHHRYWSRCW